MDNFQSQYSFSTMEWESCLRVLNWKNVNLIFTDESSSLAHSRLWR
jgi:hypothetical protein